MSPEPRLVSEIFEGDPMHRNQSTRSSNNHSEIRWRVEDRGRPFNDIERRIEERRHVTGQAFELLKRVRDFRREAGKNVYRLVGVPTNGSQAIRIGEYARKRGFLLPLPIVAMLLAETFSQDELGVDSLVVWHKPIELPRRNNPSRTRPYCLTLSRVGGRETLSAFRVENHRSFDPDMSTAFLLPSF